MAAGFSSLMNRKFGMATTIAITFAVLALMGFWVGFCETFGGYVWRREMFHLIALLIGLLGTVLVRWQLKGHLGLAIGAFVLSRIIYGLGIAFGEAFYVGPKDLTDFMHLLVLAINNKL